jgi:MoaA/NifB/PqqE/SkfB family radical SAM enzyme
MTIANVRNIVKQAQELGTINSFYFEGGEPFLCYPVLVKGVEWAVEAGFQVGIVSNAFWATDVETAIEWLEPFAGLLSDLSVSNDVYHWDKHYSHLVKHAISAAEILNIPIGTIAVAQPEDAHADPALGQLPAGMSKVMYRGRAAANLADRATKQPGDAFTTCPYENLRDPGRVHVDPFGYLHLCQGIVMGNMFETPLREIVTTFEPDTHPIVGPPAQWRPG